MCQNSFSRSIVIKWNGNVWPHGSFGLCPRPTWIPIFGRVFSLIFGQNESRTTSVAKSMFQPHWTHSVNALRNKNDPKIDLTQKIAIFMHKQIGQTRPIFVKNRCGFVKKLISFQCLDSHQNENAHNLTHVWRIFGKIFKEFETRGHVDPDKVFRGSKMPFLTCFLQSGRTHEP